MIDGQWPITKSEAARRLSVFPSTVGDLVDTLGIRTVDLPRGGHGIDAVGFDRLLRAIYATAGEATQGVRSP